MASRIHIKHSIEVLKNEFKMEIENSGRNSERNTLEKLYKHLEEIDLELKPLLMEENK